MAGGGIGIVYITVMLEVLSTTMRSCIWGYGGQHTYFLNCCVWLRAYYLSLGMVVDRVLNANGWMGTEVEAGSRRIVSVCDRSAMFGLD